MIISLRVADGCSQEAAESAHPFHLRPFILGMAMMTMMMDCFEKYSNGKEEGDCKKDSNNVLDLSALTARQLRGPRKA